MSDVNELKELLWERADEVELEPSIPPPVLRRARRRRAFNVTLAGGFAAIIAAAGFVGARSLDRDAPITPATPTPSIGPYNPQWGGIWPQATRTAAEQAQAEADAGNADFTWQLDSREVATRYVKDVVGWQPQAITAVSPFSVRGGGREQVILYSCDPSRRNPCVDPDPSKVTLTLRRLLRSDETGLWFVTVVGGPEPMKFSSPEPSGQPPAGEAPSSFVAVSRPPPGGEPTGKLVLVDSATGGVVSTILDGVDLSEGIGGLAIAPDGSTVYLAQGISACGGKILSVPVSGGQPATVATGWEPAVSPDGSMLAYVDGLYSCQTDQHLVVRNLATGEETTWALGYDPSVPRAGFNGVCRIVWFPDSRRLAFNLCYEEGNLPLVLDTVQDLGIGLKDAHQVPTGQGSSSTVYGVDGSADTLLVEQTCCWPDPTQRAVISVDPETGDVIEVLIESSSIGAGGFDATGQFLIYVDDRGDVYRWAGSGVPAKVAEDYVWVAW